MKEKIKKIKLSSYILIATALMVLIFSGISLLKIYKFNWLIYHKCEPPKYSLYEQYLAEKKEFNETPRTQVRKEVEDYKNCLKNQELAVKQRPETYKLLFIGNALIIIIGTLIAIALKESKK